MIKPFKNPIPITRPFLPPIEEYMQKVKEIWDTKWLTNMGSQHKEFEYELKKFLKVENLTLFCNGTIALQIALKCLNISGEVITTPFTFPATINSIIVSNCTPVFCDISLDDLNIDAEKVEALITKKTTAIIPVHVFGNACDVEKIEKIAQRHNLKVIYDAAHCFGVKYKEKPLCLYGDVSMLSFHATKIFHSIEGGALIYKNQELSDKFYLWKNFGIKNEDEVLLPGINGKMNEFQAAMGIINLRYAANEIQKRKAIFSTYRTNLVGIDGIKLCEYKPQLKPNYQYVPILVDDEEYKYNRDQLYEILKKYNVYSRKYFHPLGTSYFHLKSQKYLDLQNSEKIAKQILCLPSYSELSEDASKKICEIIKNA